MKLASIEKITEIKPIEGADRILAAKVLGYWTVIKKDEFKVGDYCVWHNPDTIVDKEKYPDAYAMLKEPRLKVVKLRKQVSQGLALPLEKFESIYNTAMNPVDSGPKFLDGIEGADVSDRIGIQKYEKPIPDCMKADAKGSFPSFIPKTDETNLRGYPSLLGNLYAEEEVYASVKIDGQSSTFFYKDDEFGVCSRNLQLKFNENNGFWKNAIKYKIEVALKRMYEYTGNAFALQGESYGPGIQGNKLAMPELSFAAFALYNITTAQVCSYDALDTFCKANDIPSVYTVFRGKLEDFGKNVDELLDKVNQIKYNNGSPAEGLVFRTTRIIPWADLRDLSGKIISENFALKHGE